MNTEQSRGRSRGPRKGGPSRLLCDRPMAECATLVRGSSRRITTMTAGLRARSANIRVINRRHSRLDRRLVCSEKPTPPRPPWQAGVDRSFHIRSLRIVPLATPVMRPVARMLFPSTRAATTARRFSVVSLFMSLLCLSAQAKSTRKLHVNVVCFLILTTVVVGWP